MNHNENAGDLVSIAKSVVAGVFYMAKLGERYYPGIDPYLLGAIMNYPTFYVNAVVDDLMDAGLLEVVPPVAIKLSPAGSIYAEKISVAMEVFGRFAREKYGNDALSHSLLTRYNSSVNEILYYQSFAYPVNAMKRILMDMEGERPAYKITREDWAAAMQRMYAASCIELDLTHRARLDDIVLCQAFVIKKAEYFERFCKMISYDRGE